MRQCFFFLIKIPVIKNSGSFISENTSISLRGRVECQWMMRLFVKECTHYDVWLLCVWYAHFISSNALNQSFFRTATSDFIQFGWGGITGEQQIMNVTYKPPKQQMEQVGCILTCFYVIRKEVIIGNWVKAVWGKAAYYSSNLRQYKYACVQKVMRFDL